MALKILPIAEALKKIYIKLGGDSAEVLDMSTTTELIQEIAELPLGGGGGGAFIITVTSVIGDDGTTYTADKTYREALNAILEHKNIIFIEIDNAYPNVYRYSNDVTAIYGYYDIPDVYTGYMIERIETSLSNIAFETSSLEDFDELMTTTVGD